MPLGHALRVTSSPKWGQGLCSHLAAPRRPSGPQDHADQLGLDLLCKWHAFALSGPNSGWPHSVAPGQ